MRLEELVDAGQAMEIRCHECRSRTPVDPAFFLARRGNVDILDLSRKMKCPGCGSSKIALEGAHRR